MPHPLTEPRDAIAAGQGRQPDAILLAIETAGSYCSVAVARGEDLLAVERQALRHGHAEALLPMIERVTAAASVLPSQLDVVAAAVGPGGFTGIRAGLAAARGIALALGARLIGVSNFAAVATAVGQMDGGRAGRVLVALDSRRADLYVQLFAIGSATPLAAPQAVLPERLASYVEGLGMGGPLLVAGDAAAAAAAALARRCDIAIDSAPDAGGVAAAALHQLQPGAAAEPVRALYLRPPDVTLSEAREPSAAAMP